MRKYIFLFFCLIIIVYAGNIAAQLDAYKPQSKDFNKLLHNKSSFTKVKLNWDVAFAYSFSTSGHAGVVYLPDLSEIWVSKFNAADIEILFFSNDTLFSSGDFVISGVDSIRGMTYDGNFVYASDNSNSIMILDPLNFELTGFLHAPLSVRYISYDPTADNNNGGFWIGNFTTDPTLIDRSGNILQSIPYSTLGNTGIYGAAYDYFSDDGPFLWVWGQGDGAGSPQIISQIKIANSLPTGEQHDARADALIGQNQTNCLAGGLFVSDAFTPGKIILGGVLQGDPGSDIIYGYDITGSSSITAPTAATNAATNITENSATLNGTVNPNNSSTDILFEYGTTTSYGNQIASTIGSASGDLDITVSVNLTGLQSNTTYHFRISATNGVGTNAGSDMSFTTSGSTAQPTVISASATNITSNSAVLIGLVNPNSLTTAVSFQYGTTTSYDNQIGANESPISGGNNVSISANVSGLQANTTYHFSIQATGNGNTVNGSDATFTTGINYPAMITLNNTYSFSDVLQSSNYRMIGLPGDQSTLISNLIKTGTQKKDWDAYFDNGASSNFLVEFDGSSTFNFKPGKGFWVLSKNPFTVGGQVDNVKLSADNTYSITLNSGTSGFNIISNPFDVSVSWADVQNQNGLSTNDFLFDWTGVWTHATQMEPYKAYYFKNTNSLSTLKIPYNFAAAGKITASNSQKAEIYSGDYVKLSLYQNDVEKSFVVAGFNTSAKEDYDKFDCFAPPGYFDEVRIHIEEQNLTDPYKQLFVDYRPSVNEGQSYDLKLKNDTKKTIRLLAAGVEKFTNEEVYLLDENLNRFYNLKESNEIDISPIHKNYDYRLLIGNENFIDNLKKEYVPSEYSLYQNYPNPFNPSTIIKYQIPVNNTLVELKVFNVLGKEIKTLVNKIQDSGIHEVEFNAADYSSGIYFCTLKALSNGGLSVSFSSTRKMILIK